MKKISSTAKAVMTEAAAKAIEDGKGNNSVLGSVTLSVDDKVRVLSIDYSENLFPNNREMSLEDFQKLPVEEQAKQGRIQGWFSVVTSMGNISFKRLFGSKLADWEGADRAKDYDVKKLYIPSAPTLALWCDNNFDNIIGKELRVVAVATYMQYDQEQTAYQFVLE